MYFDSIRKIKERKKRNWIKRVARKIMILIVNIGIENPRD